MKMATTSTGSVVEHRYYCDGCAPPGARPVVVPPRERKVCAACGGHTDNNDHGRFTR